MCVAPFTFAVPIQLDSLFLLRFPCPGWSYFHSLFLPTMCTTQASKQTAAIFLSIATLQKSPNDSCEIGQFLWRALPLATSAASFDKWLISVVHLSTSQTLLCFICSKLQTCICILVYFCRSSCVALFPPFTSQFFPFIWCLPSVLCLENEVYLEEHLCSLSLTPSDYCPLRRPIREHLVFPPLALKKTSRLHNIITI